MKKENKEKHFIKKPIYEGGLKGLRTFIKENLQYPQDAKKNKVEGTVFVKYTINYKGKVIEAKIIKSVGHGCDEEALRLVKMLKFKTSKTRKIKVLFHKKIQIHFRLAKESPSLSIAYNYAPTDQSDSENSEKGGSSYHYTI